MIRFIIIIGIIFSNTFFGICQSWQNNSIGINRNVPLPWTPLQVNKINNSTVSVNCWGREYIFDPMSYVNQIKISGESILSEPLSIYINNKPVKWSGISINIKESNKDKVVLETKADTKIEGSPIIFNNLIEISYDGFVYFKSTVNSSKVLNLPVGLDLSLSHNLTKYINRFYNPNSQTKVSWYSDYYSKSSTDFIPYWWIGNNSKGLFMFVESPDNWKNYNSKSAIEFNGSSQEGAEVKLSINNKLELNWNFEFGLQATPVKPLPNNYREFIPIGSIDSKINIIWPDFGKPYALKYFGFPEAKNLTAFNKHVKEITPAGKKTLVYNNITFMSEAVPEWGKNKNSWSAVGQDRSGDVKAYGNAFVRANLDDKLYQDFIIWKSREFLRSTSLDGYYVDYSMIGDLNQFKDVRKGRNLKGKFPYYPFRSMRNLYERFYKMVKSENKNHLIIGHASARVVTPILSFVDAYVDGEQFNQPVARVNDDYLKVTNLRAFQSEFSGKAYGIPAIFLPSFNAANYSKVGPTQFLASLLLIHDIQIWPIYSARVVWDEMFDVLRKFPNYETSAFIPYYSEGSIVKLNKDQVLCSVYKNSSNQYLCIITNISSEPINASMSFNIPIENFQANVISKRGSIVNKSGKVMNISIKGKDYMAIYLK
ncbi:hypothetical protein [Sphingobacterium daejeonense]|uniref:hypothetical protein n=1 Tax=Sphingobacterium daejeonense TaxID=371142 RepID=UPI003D31611B